MIFGIGSKGRLQGPGRWLCLGLMMMVALLLPSVVQAQTSYPVQVNVLVTPPYSVYLTDYYTRGSERLKVQLLLKEVDRPSFPVKLRFRIEGPALRLTSRAGVNLPPLTLQGGMMAEAAGDVLAPYLSLNALVAEGADASGFQNRGQRLADGLYKVEVWAEEMGRSVRVSNIATTFLSTMLYQSPIITSPADRAILPDQGIQHIVFQWMPRHLGASAEVTQSSYYRVRLVEVWPGDRDPQEAIRSSRPLFEGLSSSTTFVYGAGQPTLISGRRYALQVQAQDADQRDLFVGQGYSNVVSFTYGEECQVPQGLTVDVAGPGSAGVLWNANPRSTGYTFAYRRVYGQDTSWVEQPLGVAGHRLTDLTPLTSYRVRVAASCGLSRSLWSPTRTFTTTDLPETRFECGRRAELPPITDRTLYPYLKAGDRIAAADFRVEVLTASLGPGGYSGSGIARIPFLRNAPAFCSFDRVKVNGALQLYEGSIVLADSVTVIDQQLVNKGKELAGNAISSLRNKNPNATVIEVPVSGTITAVNALPGSGGDPLNPQGSGTRVEVTATGGHTTTSPGTNTKLVDESGNAVAVSQQGVATRLKQDRNAFGAGASSSAAAGEATGEGLPKVTLTLDTGKPHYGYDPATGGEPWVSIATGSSVSVTARVDLQRSPLKAEAIRYRTNDGLVVESTGTNPATLEVKGLWSSTPIPVLAVADTGRVDSLKRALILGKLNTVGYDTERRRVWLVPVNGATIDAAAAEKALNTIYRQGVVEWEVQYDPKEVSLTLSPGELQALCSGIDVGAISNYSLPMQAALKKFAREPEERTYLLFLVPGKIDRAKGDVSGFMPLNRSAGFIFLEGRQPGETYRTIAHELGHGAFGLEHVGSAAGQASSDNLMDYSGGTTLTKAQWDALHSEYRRLTWFQGSEEGKAFGDKGTRFTCLKSKKDLEVLAKYRYYYTPDGNIIDLKGYQPSGFYAPDDQTPKAPGSLYSIRFGDYDFIHLFYKDLRQSVGYGYAVGEKAFINFLPTDGVKVKEKEKEAVRVYVDATQKQLRFEQDGKVVETVPLNGECGCSEPPVEERRFVIDGSGYEKAYSDGATTLNNALYNDEELVKSLVEKVKGEVERGKSRLESKAYSKMGTDRARLSLLGEVLTDKLDAYEMGNGRQFIVVPLPVRTLSTSELSWNTLAQKVFEKAGLPSNAVLVTLPYVTSPGILSSYSGIHYFMPGLAYGNEVQINKDALGKGYSNKQKEVTLADGSQLTPVGKYVADIFKSTTKKHLVKTAYISYKGDILYQEADKGMESGYFGTYEYRISQDSRFDSYCNLLSKVCNTKKSQDKKLGEQNDLALPEFEKELDEFLKSYSQGEEKAIGHGLNERFGSSRDTVCREYARWYRDHKYTVKTIYEKASSPEDFRFYGGKNEVVYQDNLSGLDALGLVVAPVGLDWITDGISYFYAGYYGDTKNQLLYGSSALMPMVSGAMLHSGSKALLRGLATGESEVVYEGGEYVVRAVGRNADEAFTFLTKLDNTWSPELKASLTSEIGDLLKGCADDAAKVNVAEAWKKVMNAAENGAPILRKDADILTSLSKFDNRLISKIGSDKFDNFLKKLIDAKPKCKTCGERGDALVGHMDEVLDDFYAVVTDKALVDGKFVPGFDDFMKEAGEQASKAKAAALTLRKMARSWDKLTEGGWQLKSMEGGIPDIETGHRFDLQFERVKGVFKETKSVEMKNWSAARAIPADEGSQFYALVKSKKQFEYYFSEASKSGMREKFQDIFKDAAKAKKLWNANPELFKSLDANIGFYSNLVKLANEGKLKDLINWVK